MLWLLVWTPLEYGAVSPVKGQGDYVAAVVGGAYETVSYGVERVSFRVKASAPFTVMVKYWYDGEFWMRRFRYDAGERTLTFSLRGKEGAEMLPTRGLGPRPAVITVKGEGELLLSEVKSE